MHEQELAVVLLGCVVVVILMMVVGMVFWRRRVRRARLAVVRPAPNPLVKMLVDDHELAEALERAARFERFVAEKVASRARRYEELMATPAAPARRVDLQAVEVAGTPIERRSA